MVDIPKFEGAEEGPELASAIVPPASPQIPQDAPGEDLPLPPPRPPRKVGFVDLEPSVRLDASAAPPKGFVVTPGQADIDQGSDAPGRPAWSSTLGAAFRQDNTVGAFFANEMNDAPTTVDPTFNTWEAIRGTKYEDRWDSFINDRNPRAVELRKQKIDREEEDRKLLAAAPWWQSLPAQMAAGVFDLPTLLPGGAFVRGAKGGFSIARTALNVAGAAAVSSGVQEAALQGITETRTAGESAINIGASAVLGGLLGMGGAKLLSAVEWRRSVRMMEREVAGLRPMPDAQDLPEFEGADLTRRLGELPEGQKAAVQARIREVYPDVRVGSATPEAIFQSRPELGEQSIAATMTADKIKGDLGVEIPGTLLRQLRGIPESDAGGITAFHGSPHDFERFDISKIGTGEGAQAYGHGLYFAEREGVAKQYQENLSTYKLIQDFNNENPRNRPGQVAQWWNSGMDLPKIDEALLVLEPKSTQAMRDQWIREGQKLFDELASRGRLYEVRIKADPDKFLDWDKPLSEQPKAVQNAFDFNGRAASITDAEIAARRAKGDSATADFLEAQRHAMASRANMRPAEVFDLGNPDMVAKLKESGIEGIRYLDGGSRGNVNVNDIRGTVSMLETAVRKNPKDDYLKSQLDAAKQQLADAEKGGTRNFVIFDDSKVEIVAKNGQRIEKPKPMDMAGQASGSFGKATPTDWGSMTLRQIADALNKAYDTPPTSGGGSSGGVPSPGGSAANVPAGLGDNSIAGRQAAFVAAATRFLNPALRDSQSPSAATRDIASRLSEWSFYLKKNLMGVESEQSVETFMKEWNASLARALIANKSTFKDYVKAGGKLKLHDFNEEVGRAMRRNDEHSDPHITKAAKTWRKEVFDPLKKAAIEAGLLPEDVSVSTADSYFSRMWNRGALVAREGDFKGIVKGWVNDMLPQWAASYDRGVERRLEPLRVEIRDLETDKLRRASRAQEAEVDGGDFPEDQIREAIRVVKAGAPKPKGVDTLTQFVHKAGGLVEHQGELANRGISSKTRPGFVRSERRKGTGPGGWSIDDMARHAWEAGYFPHLSERPSMDEFLDALSDDFHKMRAVLRHGDRDAYRLNELVEQLEADLNRLGVDSKGPAPKFSTPDELKGMAARLRQAIDADADRRIAKLKEKLSEREMDARMERDARFLDDPENLGNEIADEVWNTLTGKSGEGVRPEFITVKARGPLKERTFQIPDHLVEEFLENDVDQVARRYVRVMSADVEMKNKFGSVDLKDDIQKIKDSYTVLRQGKSEAQRLKLDASEKSDIGDIEFLRDMLRGTLVQQMSEGNYGRFARALKNVNYIRSMGEVTLASLPDAVRPAMVHGLMAYMGGVRQLITNLEGFKMSVKEGNLAGQALESALGHRLSAVTEILDPFSPRTPVEAFLENMTNVASKWNGIRLWTDFWQGFTSVLTQHRIIDDVLRFDSIKKTEHDYLRMIGIGNDMAERIARHFKQHGETIKGLHVANTERWLNAKGEPDLPVIRAYRAAMNKDVDSIIVKRGVADLPIFSSTPTGGLALQFKSFMLSSHQRVFLRGLQEDQARFVGGLIAMTGMGMMVTYIKSWSGNRPDHRRKMMDNPGWWIGEGLDRSGVLSVPMEISNAAEKIFGVNPLKKPFKMFDDENSISQKNQNRNEFGAFLGPSAGLAQDMITAAKIPINLLRGEEVTQGQARAGVRLLPFNSYAPIRQMVDYVAVPPSQAQ